MPWVLRPLPVWRSMPRYPVPLPGCHVQRSAEASHDRLQVALRVDQEFAATTTGSPSRTPLEDLDVIVAARAQFDLAWLETGPPPPGPARCAACRCRSRPESGTVSTGDFRRTDSSTWANIAGRSLPPGWHLHTRTGMLRVSAFSVG